MTTDEAPPVETLADEAEPEAEPDPQALVWIVHPDVAVPGRVRRADVKVAWAESGWREATADEAASFDTQAVAGLRPTIDGEGLKVELEAAVLDPVVATLLARPVLLPAPEADTAPTPKSRPRAVKRS